MQKIQRLLHKARRWLAPRRSDTDDSDRQGKWEARWASDRFDPPWRLQELPDVIREAVDRRWFPPNGHLLDIGCGSGECAGWLAGRGLNVLVVDFAPSAIARARAIHPEDERLRFQVLDICREAPGRTFDALLDRGCYHGLTDHQRSDYVRHVAEAARPGAHFLLLHRFRGIEQHVLSPKELVHHEQRLSEQLRRAFQSSFDIEHIQPTALWRQSGKHAQSDALGLAVWMVRIS
jgi:SAM-dependent methyltransferase